MGFSRWHLWLCTNPQSSSYDYLGEGSTAWLWAVTMQSNWISGKKLYNLPSKCIHSLREIDSLTPTENESLQFYDCSALSPNIEFSMDNWRLNTSASCGMSFKFSNGCFLEKQTESACLKKKKKKVNL